MLRGGRHRYAEVHPKSGHRDDPSPLKVKQVWVEDERRYVVCVNEDHHRLRLLAFPTRATP
jgi:hypothetical protein